MSAPSIRPVTDDEHRIIAQFYKGYERRWVRAGDAGYLMPALYGDHAGDIRRLRVREDDYWVISFSRSGTTWLQELVWLVANGLDFAAAEATPLVERFAYIEYPLQRRDDAPPDDGSSAAGRATRYDYSSVDGLPSPRFIKTHLPPSLLPPTLLDTAKVLYIARDPRDVAVSFFYMHKLFRYFDDGVTFEQYWELFERDLLLHMPLVSHVEEAWLRRGRRNVLFIFYEDMQRDLRGVVERVCSFVGRSYSRERLDELVAYLSFDAMRARARARDGRAAAGEGNEFFRRGKSGTWPEHLQGSARAEAEAYLAKRLTTDLRYPSADR